MTTERIKVFTASKAREREALGDRVTEWLEDHDVEITGKTVTQSSDHAFHCLTITVFYRV